MIIIMLGAPASGKGTQSVVVAQKLGVPHISTGDIFSGTLRIILQLELRQRSTLTKECWFQMN
jgi:adenylate kinase